MKQDNQITIYETEDGKARIEVRFENENVWLTQKTMAELFDCSADNVSLHLKNIFAERELEPKATTEEISVVQKEGQREVKRNVTFYSLEGIIPMTILRKRAKWLILALMQNAKLMILPLHDTLDHFVDGNKMVELGSGSQRQIAQGTQRK
jgi:hypothetical protein